MVINDERTTEQQETHNILVTATDRFMSGWGLAEGGNSKCAWACDSPEKADKVFDWVSNRGDMKYVNIHYNRWTPSNATHVSIFLVEDSHPALR